MERLVSFRELLGIFVDRLVSFRELLGIFVDRWDMLNKF